jgi:hypothetical protein
MNDVNRELLDRYASFSSEELLHLAEQRDDLTAEAKGVLDLEMSRRNLSIKDIVPLEEPEPEPSPATAEADFQEIPPDFFVDDVDVETASAASRRPAGINLVAYICWLNSAWSIWIAGVVIVMPKGYRATVLNTILGIVELVIGIGLFRMRRWSLRAAILFFMLNGFIAGIFIIIAGIQVLLGYGQPLPLRSIWLFVNVIYSGIIVKYLLSLSKKESEIWS